MIIEVRAALQENTAVKSPWSWVRVSSHHTPVTDSVSLGSLNLGTLQTEGVQRVSGHPHAGLHCHQQQKKTLKSMTETSSLIFFLGPLGPVLVFGLVPPLTFLKFYLC